MRAVELLIPVGWGFCAGSYAGWSAWALLMVRMRHPEVETAGRTRVLVYAWAGVLMISWLLASRSLSLVHLL